MSPGWTGCQPNRCWVSALEAGTSMDANSANPPKWPSASSREMEVTGTSRCRPMTAAMSRNGTPSSPIACSRVPAGAASSASRNRRAASSRCTAAQRLDPSPT